MSTMTNPAVPIGVRVRLEYLDHNDAFASHLPREGTITQRCASTEANDWYLVALDEPIDHQRQIGPHFQFRRVPVSRVLIRSRWHDGQIGRREATSVFLLLVEDGAAVPDDGLRVDKYEHACWAMCRSL